MVAVPKPTTKICSNWVILKTRRTNQITVCWNQPLPKHHLHILSTLPSQFQNKFTGSIPIPMAIPIPIIPIPIRSRASRMRSNCPGCSREGGATKYRTCAKALGQRQEEGHQASPMDSSILRKIGREIYIFYIYTCIISNNAFVAWYSRWDGETLGEKHCGKLYPYQLGIPQYMEFYEGQACRMPERTWPGRKRWKGKNIWGDISWSTNNWGVQLKCGFHPPK